MMMSLFDYSLLGIKVLLHVIFSLDKKFLTWWDFTNCFLWPADYHTTTCVSKLFL